MGNRSLSGKDHPYWKRKVFENMDVDSWYPHLEGYSIEKTFPEPFKPLTRPIYIGTGPALPINNEIVEYLNKDVEATMEMFMAGGRSNGKTLRTLEEAAKKIGCRVVAESWFRSVNLPGIEKVIFNDPATIVIWDDDTKTVVKAQEGDIFDPEKGLAMAVSKKALGNKGNYFEEFKKWLPEETTPKTKPCKDFDCFMRLSEASIKANEIMTKIKESLVTVGEDISEKSWQDIPAE